MERSVAALAIGTLLLLTGGNQLPGKPPPEFRALFNGKDPIGWLCKSRGEWNTYHVVAGDGGIKLSVNGKLFNGISRSTQKKGYLCLAATELD